MIIGTCTITLYLPTVGSLKEKRSIVKSVLARVRNEFNVSIAEVDSNDVYRQAILGVACVSTAADHAQQQLENVVRFIEQQRPDAPLVNYDIELL